MIVKKIAAKVQLFSLLCKFLLNFTEIQVYITSHTDMLQSHFFYKMHIFGHKKHFFVNKFAHLTVFSYFCGLIITTDKSNTIIAYEKFILKVNLTRLNNQL